MEEELNFEIVDRDGNPVRADIHVVCVDMLGMTHEIDGISGPDGSVALPVPMLSKLDYVIVQGEGYWTFHSKEVEDFERLTLAPLPELDEPAWWLRVLGIDASNKERGSGIKIAIVDADFRQGSQESSSADDSIAGNGWAHGEMISRILCDRRSSSAYFSAAPGAEVILADAAGQEGGVDPAKAISAILKLISQDQVDLISLSWGDSDELHGLKSVLRLASEMGVTVVAASGNDRTAERPLYPARSPYCIGVGAFGMCGWGPANTVAGWYDTSCSDRGEVRGFGSIFAWSDCTCGDGMDTIGPGVGILVRRNNNVSFDLSGTSFATPLVTGALAIALAKDKKYLRLPRTAARTEHARSVFRKMCKRTGLPRKREGLGVPIVPPGE